ncbi:hypothetical protein ABZ471_46820 [Streptomyces sp. NPDC005728]|uniref:hypothetical protein n=1 Tax=Streptomyces sp. NPDC005728 TaxID=3157054 RepID=UPI0033ECCA13
MARIRIVVLATATVLCCANTTAAVAEPTKERARVPYTIRTGNTTTVFPHSTATTNIPCFPGEFSFGGGALTTGNGVFVTATRAGGAGWDVNAYNESDTPQTLTASAVCAAGYKNHRLGDYLQVPSGQSGTSRATCDPGQVASGGGNIAAGTQTYVSQSSDEGRTWVARVFNHSPFEQRVEAQVVCTTTPHTAYPSGPVTVGQGATGTAHAECKPGEVATGGGGLGDPNLQFNETYPTPTGWTVRATNKATGPLTLFARVICTTP